MRTLKCTLLAAAAWLAAASLSAQKAPEGGRINVKDNMNFEGFESLDSSLAGRRVFMTGENHSYVDLNSRLELKMLRYFHQKAGVKNFIIELGPARAHYVNRFISNADSMSEQYLKASTSPKYMKLFRRLKKWNLTLPDSMRITVHGVDVERFNDLPLMRLSELLPDSAIPANLRAGVEAVHNAAGWLLQNGLSEYESAAGTPSAEMYTNRQPFYINPTIYEFLKFYDSLQPAFSNWLGGEKGARIREAVGWLKEYKQWKDYDNTTFQYVWREEHIYLHMEELLNRDSKSRYYGQFGRCHSAYNEQNGDCGWYGYHSVINKLRTRYFKNDTSVLAIGIFYSGYSDYGTTSGGDESEKIREEVRTLMRAGEDNSITLYNLSAPEAEMPYLKKKFSYIITSKEFAAEDTDSDTVTSDTTAWYAGDEYDEASVTSHYFYGINFTGLDLSPLEGHEGIPSFSMIDVLPQHTFGSITTVDRLYIGYVGTITGRQKFAETDTSEFYFGMGQFNLEMGAAVIQRPGFYLIANGHMFLGRQQLRVERTGVSFLNTSKNNDMAVTNGSWGAGVGLRTGVKIVGPFMVGAYGNWQYDLSPKDWYIKGTSEPYASGILKTSMTGLNVGITVSAKVILD